ncbi:hypothetical protein [Neobacillus drentensis]|uniref:hypothetical protein n=1 Tax=Neobacillus drentensis TaxID=220684 RepID=UPI003002FA2B
MKWPLGLVQWSWLAVCILFLFFARLFLPERFLNLDNDTSGVLLTVLFGVTGAIISLMGLIAIFVSLSSQHKIEKCRELYWEMLELKLQELSNRKALRKLLYMYGNVFYSSENFVKDVTNLSRASILFVVVSWSLFMGLTPSVNEGVLIHSITLGGIIVLLCFHQVLGRLVQLKNTGEIEDLVYLFDMAHPEAERIDTLSLLEDAFSRTRNGFMEDTCTNFAEISMDLDIPIGNFYITLRKIQIHDRLIDLIRTETEHEEKYTWSFKPKGQEDVLFWLKHKKQQKFVQLKRLLVRFEGTVFKSEVLPDNEGREVLCLTIPDDTDSFCLIFEAVGGDKCTNKFQMFDSGETSLDLSFQKLYKKDIMTAFIVSGPNHQTDSVPYTEWESGRRNIGTTVL